MARALHAIVVIEARQDLDEFSQTRMVEDLIEVLDANFNDRGKSILRLVMANWEQELGNLPITKDMLDHFTIYDNLPDTDDGDEPPVIDHDDFPGYMPG